MPFVVVVVAFKREQLTHDCPSLALMLAKSLFPSLWYPDFSLFPHVLCAYQPI